MNARTKDRILIGIGIFGLVGFLYLYLAKLFGQHGPPPTSAFLEKYIGRNGIIILNILIFASFLAILPYRRTSEKKNWKSAGAFVGFLIALFTEMFGFPLAVYILSPFIDYPKLVPISRHIFGSFGMIAGTWLTLMGIVLVILGWRKIHQAQGLVTDGIYRYIRHPQYAGLFCIILGWLLHWPTLLTLIIFPILVFVYYRLAVSEENALAQNFGEAFEIYKRQTPRFFPRPGNLFHLPWIIFILPLCFSMRTGFCEEPPDNQALDSKVKMFLENRKGSWHDWNIPYADGKVLYDLVLKNNYKKALEIGTSTGLSTIWIAWALSKTGGRLITIEIDEGRYKEALANFKEAGVSDYIDARLANAHELVEKLKGPFDFVFSDADKDWYKNYFIALAPKLEIGGCFTAHNVRNTGMEGISEFIDYITGLPNFKTTIDKTSGAGISISYKMAQN